MKLDTIVIGFHETALPPMLGALPPDDPLGYYYRTACLRLAGKDVEPLVALSRLNNAATGASALYHWTEAAPLAVHHLTAYLRQRGFGVEMLRFVDAEHERLEQLLLGGDPLSVCIPTTFYVDPLPILDLVSFIRRCNPKVKIILGGPFVHDLFRDRSGPALVKSLELLGADVVVRCSAGEKTLARVLRALRCGGDLADVPNLAVLERGRFVGLTTEEPELDDLDDPLDFDQLSDDELGTEVNLRTAMGCSFACEFCEFPVRGGSHRVASVATVEKQLRQLDKRGVRYVCFVDDTFNVPLPRFQQICDLMVENRFSFRWSSHFRASSGQRPELYDRMRESGCTALHLGLESGDEAMLSRMSKVATLDQYEYAIEQCNQKQILTHAALIVGFPGETETSIESTISFMNRTQPTTFRPQPFFYHHHAPVHGKADEHGLEGKGWSWRHSTMTSREAVAAAQHVRESIKGPRFTGDRQLHVFMLPWLLCKGMRTEDLLELLTTVDEVQRVSFDRRPGGEVERRHAALATDLEALCRRVRLEPARFSIEALDSYPSDLIAAGRVRAEYLAVESVPRGLWPRRGPSRERLRSG